MSQLTDRPAVRVGGFVAGIAAVFTLALAAGSFWGPTIATPASEQRMAHGAGGPAGGEAHRGHGAPTGPDSPDRSHDSDGSHLPGGLMTSQDGYTLDLTGAPGGATAAAREDAPLSMEITGPDGQVLATPAAYDVEHGKRLHLIAVRRDLTGFQHVHPALRDGRWSTTLDLTPGSWRVFADFKPAGGPALTLGRDLLVPGRVSTAAPVARSRSRSEVGAYTVEVDGRLVAGTASDLTLTVSRRDTPVRDLQPYLGAFGHLVALREGDLAYLHVHPHEDARTGQRGGPAIRFSAEVPSAGRYRLFFDFKHRGDVRTATFDLTAVGG